MGAADFPDLSDHLGPNLDESLVPLDLNGPRRWWGGALDVEGLALGSVSLALAAAQLLSDEHLQLGLNSANVFGAFSSIDYLLVDGRPAQGFAPLSGFYATADGWIRVHANYPHHFRALLVALNASDKAGVTTALQSMTALAAEQQILDAGGIAAAMRTRLQWEEGAPGEAQESWLQFELPTDVASTTRKAELSGLRVVDLTRVIAGPTATQFLAALGADVLRIDPPAIPELLDQHVDRDFGKRVITADLAEAGVLSQLHELLGQADLLITGYRPDALAKFGLEWEQVHNRYPQLVMAQLNAWGRIEPWSRLRGFDSIVQSATGIADLYAIDGKPGSLPVQALDHATGYTLAAAALTLLHRRNTTGQAGYAHISLAGTANVLFDLPACTAPIIQPTPILQTTQSNYGQLRHVAPVFTRATNQISYRHAPLPPLNDPAMFAGPGAV